MQLLTGPEHRRRVELTLLSAAERIYWRLGDKGQNKVRGGTTCATSYRLRINNGQPWLVLVNVQSPAAPLR